MLFLTVLLLEFIMISSKNLNMNFCSLLGLLEVCQV